MSYIFERRSQALVSVRRVATATQLAAWLGMGGVVGVTPALAQNEPVRIFNRAGFSASALHVAPAGQTTWSGNLLSRGALGPGQFLSVRLGEGAGCSFDLRMVLTDGTEILRRNADVCATRSVDLVPSVPVPAAPPILPLPQVGGGDRMLPSIERPQQP